MFTIRFFIGLVVLLIAVFLQFFLLPLGIAWNILFAILIAFAFIFDFFAFLLFDLLAVFLVNWQPGLSPTLIAFAVIPLLVFAFRTAIRPEAWVGVLISIFAGFALFLRHCRAVDVFAAFFAFLH